MTAALVTVAFAASVTQWQVREAPGLDAALFLGALSGDILVERRGLYRDELAWAKERFPPEALTALDRIDRIVRAEGKGLVGPWLALFLSVAPMESLEDVIRSVHSPAENLRKLEATSYWDEGASAEFMRVQPDLERVLRALDTLEFERHYRSHVLPKIRVRTAALVEALSPHDVIPEQERLLGRTLKPAIEVFVVAFNRPYGIRIVGQRFITHVDWSSEITLRNAVHEMFHPPFDPDNESLRRAFAALENDPWMRNVVENHDPAFGYNSFIGLLDEDSTRALDQIVSERLGVARHMGERVRSDDDGMHVLSAALYHAMKETGFAKTGGSYQRWLIDAAKNGLLSPEAVRRRVAEVAGPEAVERWRRPQRN